MRALQKKIVQDNFDDKWEESLDEKIENENQYEEDKNRKKCCVKQHEHTIY